MITPLILATVIVSQSATTPQSVISTMNRYYAGAEKLSADITLVQTLGTKSTTIKSFLQYHRPGKFYLQQKMANPLAEAFAISDGTNVGYTPPRNMPTVGSKLVYERQRTLTVSDVYTISTPGLVDRSPVLDIMVCKPAHVRYVIEQMATIKLEAPTEAGDHVVTGNWRSHGESVTVGTYRLVVSQQGELKRYERRERVVPPGQKDVMSITSVWTATTRKGVVDDPTLFSVR